MSYHPAFGNWNMLRLFLSFYMLITVSIGAYMLSESYIRSLLFQDMFELNWAEDYSGLFYLLDELYKNVGHDSFGVIMDSYPRSINLPLERLSMDELDIPEAGLSQLVDGKPYVANILDIVLYSKIAESSEVVRIGPTGIYAPLDRVRIIYQLSLFALLALPVFFWVANLQAKTRRLEVATVDFGKGDFSTRVSEEGKHRVGHLNGTFNFMAERVERLINGHKNLTNAVAHELRTPISRIRFQLDMLYVENDDSQRRGYIHGISDDVTELGELVDELLTYAQFDREPTLNTMQPHSLHDSIKRSVAHKSLDSKVNIEYISSWFDADSSLQYVNFYPKYLERAIGNIIKNAEKYAASRIIIQVKRVDHFCTVFIDDDGPGIQDDERARIFDPFSRLDDSRSRATGGYGLGLAIVKQIAQLHTGTVSVSDAPIGGARFEFTWPGFGTPKCTKS